MHRSALFFSCLLAVVHGTVFGGTRTPGLVPNPDFSDPENWSIHYQITAIPQYHPPIRALYSGANSLSPNRETITSYTSTLFLGRKLWKGGELYMDPELQGGGGFSGTTGLAGFPNGEIYRVSSLDLSASIARIYWKQTFNLQGENESVPSDQNQLQATQSGSRFTFLIGKFSLTDFFDANAYSHDPRTQFFNWAVMTSGSWDFAADTRGYTWGVYTEFNQPQWAIRFASVMEPLLANQMDLDENVRRAHGDNLELEWRHSLLVRPGKVRLNGYMNHAHMGNYRATLATPGYGLDITRSRDYTVKTGLDLSLEQDLTPEIGAFLRLGWSDGQTETWAFTEIDRTFSLGTSIKGSLWHRDEDMFGLAVVANGLSDDHKDYLAAGGYGFIIGDGALRYGPEEILETYYSLEIFKGLFVTADFQAVDNPAYNQDRGPVTIIGGRFHFQI